MMSEQFYYAVDSLTGEVSQVKTIAQNRGGIAHIPVNALRVEPLPIKEGFSVVASAGLAGTEYIEDHRDEVIFSTTDSTTNKRVTELGVIEEGWTLSPPLAFSTWVSGEWIQQLDLLQQAKSNEINAWRDSEELNSNAIVIVDDIEWDANPESRQRIESTIQSSFIPPFWTDASNKDQVITVEQLQRIQSEIVQLGFRIHARQREMKAEIATLTTVESLSKYIIGWSE